MMGIKKHVSKYIYFWLAGGVVLVLILVLSPFYGDSLLDTWREKTANNQLTLEDLKDSGRLKATAEAAGGLPWQFGGTVIFYQPACTVDNQSGTCPSSCPMCTQMVGQACSSYEEIRYQPAAGSNPSVPPGTVCAPKGFKYQGGVPAPGGQILGGGASPQMPWVIGVSGGTPSIPTGVNVDDDMEEEDGNLIDCNGDGEAECNLETHECVESQSQPPQDLVRYYPLYDRGWTISYYEDQLYVGEVKTVTRSGFTGLYDPYDPILICQVENEDNCTTPPQDSYRFGHLADRQWPGVRTFRLYIPPGNEDFSFIAYLPQSAELGLAVRFREPPTGDYDNLVDYYSYDWTQDPNEQFSFFEGNDVLARNQGGHIAFNVKGSPAGGGWLYFKTMSFDGSSISSFSHSLKVNMDTYASWYDNANFDGDGNPPPGGGSKVCQPKQ
jgi:hypothetical protein